MGRNLGNTLFEAVLIIETQTKQGMCVRFEVVVRRSNVGTKS